MKQIKMKSFHKLFSMFILIGFFLSSPAFAQETTPTPLKVLNKPAGAINMTISPTYVNLTTDPGKEVSSQFSVTNNNAYIEYFKVSLVKYEVTNGEGLTIANVKKDDPFLNWITFQEKEFSVDTNQVKKIKFTIKPSKDAALGYYYGIMVSRIDENLTTGKSSVTGAPVFSVLLEVVTPNAKRELQFKSFKTDTLFYEYLPIQFNVQLKNTGNIHVIPSGDIFIDQGKKKDIAIIPVNPSHGNILPNAERTFTVKWDDGFAVKNESTLQGKKKGTTKYDFTKADRFRIGKYTAHVLMVYDNGERDVPLEGVVSFWVIPWKIILGGVGVLIFAFIGLRSTFVSIFRKK